MDFENQFTRPMIQALGARMAILKMESACDKPDDKFQRGFELGFQEAFNFIREFGRADELIKLLDIKEKAKKAAEHAKETGIPQLTAVQGKNIEPMPVTDVKIHDIPSFAGPLSDGEKIEQNLQTLMDDAGVPDLRVNTSQMETFHKSIADFPDLGKGDVSVEVFVRCWLYAHCSRLFGKVSIVDTNEFDKIRLDELGLHESEYLDLMRMTLDKYGSKGDCYIGHMEFLHTIGDLVQYYKNHTNPTYEPKATNN